MFGWTCCGTDNGCCAENDKTDAIKPDAPANKMKAEEQEKYDKKKMKLQNMVKEFAQLAISGIPLKFVLHDRGTEAKTTKPIFLYMDRHLTTILMTTTKVEDAESVIYREKVSNGNSADTEMKRLGDFSDDVEFSRKPDAACVLSVPNIRKLVKSPEDLQKHGIGKEWNYDTVAGMELKHLPENLAMFSFTAPAERNRFYTSLTILSMYNE